jgi:Flp pilus assembly secretin CpaC
MTTKEEIWQGWTDRYIGTEQPIPLFETDENLTVQYKHYGQNDRRILK